MRNIKIERERASPQFGGKKQFVRDEAIVKSSPNHNDLQSAWKQDSKFLHFTLANTPDEDTSCKTENTAIFSHKPFGSFHAADYQIYAGSCGKFASTIDKWFVKCDLITKSDVVEVAKLAHYLAIKYGSKSVLSVRNIIERRLSIECGHTSLKQMILLYLTHIIMTIEVANPQMGPGPRKRNYFCEEFEETLRNPKANLFRRLVERAYAKDKQELYSLRCKWGYFFSSRTLQIIDGQRQQFWEKQAIEPEIIEFTVFCEIDNSVTTATITTNDRKRVIGDVQSREYDRRIPVSRDEELKQQAEKMKRKRKKEDLIKSKTKELETLFIPDVIVPAPAIVKRKVSNNIDEEDNKKRKTVPNNSTKSSSINNSELLDINGQPLRARGSKCEKAMEELQKMFQERNGVKKAPNNTGGYQNSLQRNQRTTVKVIDNFQNNDFIDCLLSPTLEDSETVFQNGMVQMKFIHRL